MNIMHPHSRHATLRLTLAAALLLCSSAPLRAAADHPLAPQIAKMVPQGAEEGDVAGWSADISGDLVAIGAPKDLDGLFRGKVYLFERDAGGPDAWGQTTDLEGSDQAENDDYGWSVGTDGSHLVASAPYDDENGTDAGAAYLYAPDPVAGGWDLVVRWTPSDPLAGDKFGYDVVIEGSTAVVGAFLADIACPPPDCDDGAVYVFTEDAGGPGVWGESAKVVPTDGTPGGKFGKSVDLRGDLLAVGAPGFAEERVYLFERTGPGTWSEVARLTPPGPPTNQEFGGSVALAPDGATLVVGASTAANPLTTGGGAAFVYERDGDGAWQRVAELWPPDSDEGERFGGSVGIAGDLVVIGARRDGRACRSCREGAVYLYRRDQGGDGAWGGVVKLTADDAEARDLFGTAVAIDGTTIAIGAPEGDAMSPGGPGSAYVFEWAGLPSPVLALDGTCPGTMTASVSGLTPGATARAIWSTGGTGSFLLEGGSCDGTIVNMPDPISLGTRTADALGELTIEFQAPEQACGTTMQFIDQTTCAASNVAPLP